MGCVQIQGHHQQFIFSISSSASASPSSGGFGTGTGFYVFIFAFLEHCHHHCCRRRHRPRHHHTSSAFSSNSFVAIIVIASSVSSFFAEQSPVLYNISSVLLAFVPLAVLKLATGGQKWVVVQLVQISGPWMHETEHAGSMGSAREPGLMFLQRHKMLAILCAGASLCLDCKLWKANSFETFCFRALFSQASTSDTLFACRLEEIRLT